MYEYKNKIFNMDCLAGMAMLPDSSVDMVLTDLPYSLLEHGARADRQRERA